MQNRKTAVNSRERTAKLTMRKEIMAVAWPVLLELVLSALFGMIDMMMLGNIPDHAYAAAAVSSVGLTNQPLFLGIGVVQAFNVGGTAIIARYYGAGEKHRMQNVLKHVVLFSTLFSMILSLFGLFNAEAILTFMGGEPETVAIGAIYFRIICISYLFQSFNMGISGALRGIGDTKTPMKINLRVNLLNVFGNAVLIYGLFGLPRLLVAGAAVSTAFANFVASVQMIRYLTSGKSELTLDWKEKFVFNKKTMRDILQIGLPSAGEQLVLRAGAIIFVQIVSSLGTVVFAAHQIGMNILSLSFTLGQAFGIASSSLVGRTLGRRQKGMATDYATMTGKIASNFGMGLGLVFFVGAESIVGLYSNDPNIVQSGAMALRIVSLVQPFQAHQLTTVGTLRGAGDTLFPLFSTFAGILVVRTVTAYVLINMYGMGLMGAWIAIVFDQLIRWLVIGFRFRSGKWRNVVIT
ncbi:MATE family efflux transporter [Atopococcus tabaci]|uniref:MATE family efflux transporter n=1 Tax=Atopococcus tabaci TaxID=269774 RepID=UPI002409EC5B|nr:MATE family efflux transporter [Atopococcus tabaci]